MLRMLFVLVLCGAPGTAQDRIELSNGTVVAGEIVGFHLEGVLFQPTPGTKLDLPSRSDGSYVVPWNALEPAGVRSTSVLVLELKNGDRVSGRVTNVADGRLSLTNPLLSELSIPRSALSPMPSTEPDEGALENAVNAAMQENRSTILEEKKWAGKVALLGTLRSGNIESSLFQLNLDIARHWSSNRFKSHFNVAYGETEGETTASSAWSGAQWDHFYTPDYYSYARVDAEYDDLKELDLRAIAGIGVGVNVWRGEQDDQTLDLEAGVDTLYEKFQSIDRGQTNLATRIAVTFQNRLFEDWVLSQELEFISPVVNLGDFIFRSRTGLETRLTDHWHLQNILEIDWQGTPPPSAASFDLKLLVGVQYEF